ncbi:peptidase M42 family protein [Candidatus Omnitrophus magneticus]|uniref:Peptidase M42 family protein n=1 Tax=Candidatus Omnitrophus magneticus TaxID=1609969 RepID=A0A0F0CM03_9BACT|nr:peptidase M42 family protein [Candidatus Omnitrophus magneticus]
MKPESISFLKNLINSASPSGFEQDAVKVWTKRAKEFCDEVKNDVHGNSIGIINKEGDPRVMLAGHIDEIGYMVKYIDKEGYIYFSTIGGIDPHIMPGKRVIIDGKKGPVLGIIGRKPIHLIVDASERSRVAKVEEMWIDIGAKDEKEALERVSIGDAAVVNVGFEELNGTKVIGRGFDDRIGAFVVNEVLSSLKGKKINAGVYGTATVQEEIGLRGAQTSAYSIKPDIGVAIDVTFASDTPGVDKRMVGDVKLGAGPVISRGPNINSKVFELLVQTAKKNKIPYQIEGASRGTGTDANIIQLTRGGVATALVSIPNRYMHTPVEMIDLKDVENAVKLISAFVSALDKKMDFTLFN